ncbi:MAG: hypothetical protein V1494_01105 [Candidatus Diapherotrites archaeon]
MSELKPQTCAKCGQILMDKAYFEQIHNKPFLYALQQLELWQSLKEEGKKHGKGSKQGPEQD